MNLIGGGANEISEGEGTPVDDEQLESVVGGMRALETEREGKKP